MGARFALHVSHMDSISALQNDADSRAVASPKVGREMLRRMIATYAVNSVSVQLDLDLGYFVGT